MVDLRPALVSIKAFYHKAIYLRGRYSKQKGVLRLFSNTPFLVVLALGFLPVFSQAADNPIVVESLDAEPAVSKETQMVPFQAPVEEVPAEMQGIEDQYQQQLLQQEVMELRGLVEELQFQVKRMKVTQEDRYLELDKRFQTLQQQFASGVSTPAATPVLKTDTESQAEAETGQSEKVLYETALELIRNRQYDLAITQLQAVIAQYPDGSYAPNAYYWLGEVYAAMPKPDYENARKALAQVITFFPNHRKVPDATFKLGKVYNLMGDCARATELLKQVIDQQQGKSVGKLAEAYLKNKVNCE